MPHIPRALCATDNKEMIVTKNAVLVQMDADWGAYYKIFADQHTCPVCQQSVLLFAERVLIESYQPGFADSSPNVVGTFFTNGETK